MLQLAAAMMMRSAIVAVAILCSVAAPTVEAGQQTTAPAGQTTASTQSTGVTSTGNADVGRETYIKKGCYACHGREGQGSPTAGPRLGPNPTALASFTRYVRAPRGTMPPYTEKVISDRELADIHAFLEARARAAAIDGVLPLR